MLLISPKLPQRKKFGGDYVTQALMRANGDKNGSRSGLRAVPEPSIVHVMLWTARHAYSGPLLQGFTASHRWVQADCMVVRQFRSTIKTKV